MTLIALDSNELAPGRIKPLYNLDTGELIGFALALDVYQQLSDAYDRQRVVSSVDEGERR